MHEKKPKKQDYVKPTLIEIGKMRIVTKNNSGSLVTDNTSMPTHMHMA